jgi:hypothetical protein
MTQVSGLSTLAFTRSGSGVNSKVQLPSSTVLEWSTDTGISRLAAGSLAIGNGTAGDFTGSLKLTNITMGSSPILNNTAGNLIVEPFSSLVVSNTGATLNTWLINPNLSPPLCRFASTLAIAFSSGDAVSVAQDVQLSRAGVGILAVGTTYNNANPALGTLLLTELAFSNGGSATPDSGISRLAAGSIAIGNGTAGDFSGSLKLTTLTAVGGVSSGSVGTAGVLTLVGSTSGSATFTAPAVAGTVTNPVLVSNSLQLATGNVLNWNADTGISRISGAIIAVGNGTAGDISGNIRAQKIYLYSAGASQYQFEIDASANRFGLGVSTNITWSAGDATGTADTNLSRISPGIIGVGTGVQGNSGGTALAAVYGWGATTSATSADTGISRLGAASLAIGNGTAGDFSGTLKCATVNATSAYQANGTPGVTQTAITVGTLATIEGIVTTFTGVSDERLKNHAPYTGGLEEILGITPIRFTYNELGQKFGGWDKEHVYVGFSAQNVQKSIPEAIQGTEGKEKYLSFDDRPVIAALCNAIKELTARITELEMSVRYLLEHCRRSVPGNRAQ